MRTNKLYEKIIEENYAAVYRFCKARIWNDDDGAEECTQEVFLLFLQKNEELDLNGPINRWLIAAASRITKKYLRKKAQKAALETEVIDELIAPEQEDDERITAFQSLTGEELDLLRRYYDTEADSREKLAQKLGITMNALYQRIFAIKSKIKS